MFWYDAEYMFDLPAVVCREVSNFLPSYPNMAGRNKKHMYEPVTEWVSSLSTPTVNIILIWGIIDHVQSLCILKIYISYIHYCTQQTFQTQLSIMSWILSLQAYCEIQDNVSSIHAIEQKILTLPCRDYKISAHLLQQSHGNRTKTDLHVGKDPLPS